MLKSDIALYAAALAVAVLGSLQAVVSGEPLFTAALGACL
jgi:hypothetical protein